MVNSVHDKLGKVRKPRIHITYDVETEGATVKKELPFILGVMGDFSGNAGVKKPLKERKFVQIDGDNFNDVMQRTAPAVELKVANTLKGDGSEMAVNLEFKSMDDFEPSRIIDQVEPLKKLIDTRKKLSELLSKADRSADLESLLERILQNSDDLKEISEALKVEATEEATS